MIKILQLIDLCSCKFTFAFWGAWGKDPEVVSFFILGCILGFWQGESSYFVISEPSLGLGCATDTVAKGAREASRLLRPSTVETVAPNREVGNQEGIIGCMNVPNVEA